MSSDDGESNSTFLYNGVEYNTSVVSEWLVEPRNSTDEPCPLGFVCDDENMANCTKIRIVSLAYGFGDVHAGFYCPEGEDGLLVCPVGHYCPLADVEEPIVCDDGYFCPHKTTEPAIKCRGCDAGETELVREIWGWILIALLLFALILYVIIARIRRSSSELKERIKELSSRQYDAAKAVVRRRQRRKELERLKPKLFAIQKRLETLLETLQETLQGEETASRSTRMSFAVQADGKGLGNSDLSVNKSSSSVNKSSSVNNASSSKGNGNFFQKMFNSSSGKLAAPSNSSSNAFKSVGVESERIYFNASVLFDSLDTDGNGVLDFDELMPILELTPVQVKEFIRRLNELAQDGSDPNTVERQCFTRYFLRVLQETSHFGPTEQEVDDLFDELMGEDPQYPDHAAFASFFESPTLTQFMSDPEINNMILFFQVLNSEDKLSTRPGVRFSMKGEQARSGLGGAEANKRMSMVAGAATFGLFGGGGGDDEKERKYVSRQVFCEHYAEYLVTMVDDPEAVTARSAHKDDLFADADLMGVDLTFEDLSLTVSVGDKEINVVNHVSGRLASGTMTALMGGSGAGKTSLLNALCGRAFYGDVSGTIRINGHITTIEEHKSSTGFVPQDDIVHAELTVRENLIYSGRFTLPRGTPMRAIEDLADSVLANLGLSRVANSMVGDVNRRGVSGGEKKRVNIGVELMSCPSLLFLDEPTSGLDSSSALLVMGSLKNLCEKQGVTVLSVIHQPRKAIFDSFDSLILLGVGGNMVYHGPTSQAQSYFARMDPPYSLPQGESVADWLIDVSSGRLVPDEKKSDVVDIQKDSQAPEPIPGDEIVDVDQLETEEMDGQVDLTDMDYDDDVVLAKLAPSTAKYEHSLEIAKERRQHLYDQWIQYYEDLSDEERAIYLPPDEYALPSATTKPRFGAQLKGQLQRNMLMMWRNRVPKAIDTTMIVGAVLLISFLEGTVELTYGTSPRLTFEELTTGNPIEVAKTFPELFNYALRPTPKMTEYALKVGVITAVLLGLNASKSITGKRLEFFRESGSGWDINAYFLALNITSTFEHTLQMILAAGVAFWLRDSAASGASTLVNYLMLMWLVVSWSFLIPLLVPANNSVLAVGFFMAFFGLLFSGGLEPVTYETIYDNDVAAVFCGIISVTRYFIEGMAVQEQRALPQQSGFTVESTSVNFPIDILGSFHLVGMAQNDSSVVRQTFNGWYWGVLPAIWVGLTIRFLAGGVLHISERSKQAKRSLWSEVKKRPVWRNRASRFCFGYVIVLIAMFLGAVVFIQLDYGSTGVRARPNSTQEAEFLADEILGENFPNDTLPSFLGEEGDEEDPDIDEVVSVNGTDIDQVDIVNGTAF